MLPVWAQIVIGIGLVAVFFLMVFGIAGSSYGDWVQEFYTKRDRLTTIFGSEDKPKSR